MDRETPRSKGTPETKHEKNGTQRLKDILSSIPTDFRNYPGEWVPGLKGFRIGVERILQALEYQTCKDVLNRKGITVEVEEERGFTFIESVPSLLRIRLRKGDKVLSLETIAISIEKGRSHGTEAFAQERSEIIATRLEGAYKALDVFLEDEGK